MQCPRSCWPGHSYSSSASADSSSTWNVEKGHRVVSRPPSAYLQIEGATKSFDGVEVVSDFSLEVGTGEFVSLLGPSGCGKTTLLRMVAGFEFPDRGRIVLDSRDITQLPAHKRPVNMVFQRVTLFPHLDVFENIAFGLRLAHVRDALVR